MKEVERSNRQRNTGRRAFCLQQPAGQTMNTQKDAEAQALKLDKEKGLSKDVPKWILLTWSLSLALSQSSTFQPRLALLFRTTQMQNALPVPTCLTSVHELELWLVRVRRKVQSFSGTTVHTFRSCRRPFDKAGGAARNSSRGGQ